MTHYVLGSSTLLAHDGQPVFDSERTEYWHCNGHMNGGWTAVAIVAVRLERTRSRMRSSFACVRSMDSLARAVAIAFVVVAVAAAVAAAVVLVRPPECCMSLECSSMSVSSIGIRYLSTGCVVADRPNSRAYSGRRRLVAASEWCFRLRR